MKQINLTDLARASEIRIHPDDRDLYENVLNTIAMVLKGPTVQTTETGEWVTKDPIHPGYYRLLPIIGFPGEKPDLIERPGWTEPPEWEEQREAIWRGTKARWDWSGPHPTPKPGTYTCLCGNDSWSVRHWTYFDYRDVSGDVEVHMFRHRVDVSLKCTGPDGCGWVPNPFGVVIPNRVWKGRSCKTGLVQAKSLEIEK